MLLGISRMRFAKRANYSPILRSVAWLKIGGTTNPLAPLLISAQRFNKFFKGYTNFA
jgi:hypothetical protein